MIGYLANKPTGADLVYLIVGAVLFALAVLIGVAAAVSGRNGNVANWQRALTSAALLALTMAFLTR